jgi:folate-binding protein YgfZ
MQVADSALGEVYVMNQPRLGSRGFDLFVPVASKEAAFARLSASCQSVGGRPCGWQALETARIEAGIPRYGADMDESNLAFECGIVERAVSFTKGCYIGQEVLNRLHTMGHVNKDLRRLRLSDNLSVLPAKDDKLFFQGKEVGYITSALASPTLKTNIALGYVRREANAVGTELVLLSQGKETPAWVVGLPFTPFLGD